VLINNIYILNLTLSSSEYGFYCTVGAATKVNNIKYITSSGLGVRTDLTSKREVRV